MAKRTDDKTLVSALRVLARDIRSQDGVANAAVTEAAERLEEFSQAMASIRDAVLHERFQLAEMGAGNDVINAVLGIIDDYNPSVP